MAERWGESRCRFCSVIFSFGGTSSGFITGTVGATGMYAGETTERQSPELLKGNCISLS